MTSRLPLLLLPLLALAVPGPGRADLEPRLDGRAVYDPERDISWLADANLPLRKDFGVDDILADGRMPFARAQEWIAALNGTEWLGFDDWRLPGGPIPDPDCSGGTGPLDLGFGCTGSELAHLYAIELGATPGTSVLVSGDPDLALFSNIQGTSPFGYWSGVPANAETTWGFFFANGLQGAINNVFLPGATVWPVRDGDVGNGKPPVATFTFEQSGLTRTVLFDASGSFDPDDDPDAAEAFTYEWDFDGEGTATEMDPNTSFEFDEFGPSKSVTLRVIDDEGDADTIVMNVPVLSEPPFANFTFQSSLFDPLEILFNAVFSLPSGAAEEIVEYAWDFGDGATLTTSSDMTSHVYGSASTNTVTLTVTDDLGFQDSVEIEVAAGDGGTPKPDFTAEQRAFPPFQVLFVGSDALSNETAIQGWEWDFGDGTMSLGKIQLHQYPLPGKYDVTLTAEILTGDSFDREKEFEVGFFGVFVDGLFTTLKTPAEEEQNLKLDSGQLPPGLAPQLVTLGWPVIFPGGVGEVTGASAEAQLDGVAIARAGNAVGNCMGAGCGACSETFAGTIDAAPNRIDIDGTPAARPGGRASLLAGCGPGVALLASCKPPQANPTLAQIEAAGCLPFGVETVLTEGSFAGDQELLASDDPIEVGADVVIGPGTPRQEIARLESLDVSFPEDFGPPEDGPGDPEFTYRFDAPLQFAHPPGEELATFDGDSDGVPLGVDNCSLDPNPSQANVDGAADDDSSRPGVQRYGDACDVDLDDDGVVGPSDFFGVFRPCLGADLAATPSCVEADLDGDGAVGPSDFFSGLRPALGDTPGPGATLVE
ncbi:MAG: PKD domain-containing protein [Myxococcota bacterium]|nr:PKD domain-containing protein [Myxococcota bacterium]